MRKIDNLLRIKRLIENAIKAFSLDLHDITVLTEAASGPFVATCLIAALAGAKKVIAITRDSEYGSAEEVIKYTQDMAEYFGVSKIVHAYDTPALFFANEADLVTNLGFVRPINSCFIKQMKKQSAISLMWETWESRKDEVDIECCFEKNIPVLGVSENDHRLQTFKYLGLLAIKLLLEENIEVFKSNILLIGSGIFGQAIRDSLTKNNAYVLHIDLSEGPFKYDNEFIYFIQNADAIIVAEHSIKYPVIGGEMGIPIEAIKERGVKVIHISGCIDYDGLTQNNIVKTPLRKVAPGYMTVTTDYVGPRPVIELHTAGLKVGEALVRGMRLFNESQKAIEYALANSPAMDFPKERIKL